MGIRVAMLSLHTSPLARLGRTRDAGGMNVYVRELSRELGRNGILVDVFTRWTDPNDPPIEPLGERARLIRMQAGPTAALPTSALAVHVDEFARRIMRFAQRNGHPYDVVHSHYWLSGVAGLTLTRAWDVPHVAMFHTVERLKGERMGAAAELSPASQLRAECEGVIAGTADCVTVASSHERDQLQRLYGVSGVRIEIIPCGVDLRTFRPATPEHRSAARAALGVGRAWVGGKSPLAGRGATRAPAALLPRGGRPGGGLALRELRPGRGGGAGLWHTGRGGQGGRPAQHRTRWCERRADPLATARDVRPGA